MDDEIVETEFGDAELQYGVNSNGQVVITIISPINQKPLYALGFDPDQADSFASNLVTLAAKARLGHDQR